MKKITLATLIFISSFSYAQKKQKKEDILVTKDIQRIEEFLKTAHPEDPRRSVLKPKLAALKNAAWTKGAKDAKPMAARPVITEIPNSIINRPNSSEAEEFKKLMAESSEAHTGKTVKLLNTLFDQDINKKEAIILIQNNSDCNMIVRIQGSKDFYNLAVPAKGENSLVLNKGSYQLTSNICDVKYTSTKDISKNLLVVLNNPVLRPPVGSSLKTKNGAQK